MSSLACRTSSPTRWVESFLQIFFQNFFPPWETVSRNALQMESSCGWIKSGTCYALCIPHRVTARWTSRSERACWPWLNLASPQMIWLRNPRYRGLTRFHSLQTMIAFCRIYLKYTWLASEQNYWNNQVPQGAQQLYRKMSIFLGCWRMQGWVAWYLQVNYKWLSWKYICVVYVYVHICPHTHRERGTLKIWANVHNWWITSKDMMCNTFDVFL